MNVVVADTSVLVDLERVGLLESCFRLPYQLAVPDLLYRNELSSRRDGLCVGESLLALGLKIEGLDGDEVSSAMVYKRKLPRLSLSDSFALALAASRQWILLTSDEVLRTFATTLSVACRGVLWIVDQLFGAGLSSAEDLASGLRALRDHPRCRLPQNEVATRIAL